MTRVAAILIVKGCQEDIDHLRRLVGSIKGHVDGIFINLNHKPGQRIPIGIKEDVRTMLKLSGMEYDIIETEWHDHFAEARNANLAQVPKDYDWVIWLDADDTIDHPEKIRKVADASGNYDCVYVDYDYDHDQFGNVTTVHMVGRLFKNNGSHRWNPKTRIHETLVETRSVVQGMTKDFKVIHHAEAERTLQSYERNVRLLEQQLKDEGHDRDPRTIYYLACAYLDGNNNERAKQLFYDYLDLSGWDQERAVALTKLGKLYLEDGDRSEARKCFAWASAEDPQNPEPRVELGSLEIELENWNKARTHLEYVLGMGTDQTTLERNPLNWTFRTYLLLAECYLNMGGKWLDKALEYGEKALAYRKKDKGVKKYVEAIRKVVDDKKTTEALARIYRVLETNQEPEKVTALLQAIPKQLDDNPLFVKLRQKYDGPFKWPKQSIVIMTGNTAIDAWGPWSLKEGIGGSEEAIIRLAPKLAKHGYKVVVFGKPGNRAGLDTETGVMWRNYDECNLDDEFDIFIAWRAPFIFDKQIKARKSYLWLHDVMEPGEFTEQRIANFTKCIVLSKYHRSLYPMIPDEKILLSGNGIDPEEFSTDLVRNPYKIFYGSSHVRGLAYLYEIWPEVKAAVPEATLDVYYGRESYDKINANNPERLKWMDDMMAKAKELDGVTDHGKVGQDELVQRMFESGIWAYPCPFPEIYAITAVKAQAAGCIPVSTDFAALDETVQFGTKVTIPNDGHVGHATEEFLEQFKMKLIWWLQNPGEQARVRPAMMRWAKTQSWSKIASQWCLEFEQ